MTFHARITTVHLFLSKLHLKHYWFHFFWTRCNCNDNVLQNFVVLSQDCMIVFIGDAWALSQEYFGSGWSNCDDTKINILWTPWCYIHIVSVVTRWLKCNTFHMDIHTYLFNGHFLDKPWVNDFLVHLFLSSASSCKTSTSQLCYVLHFFFIFSVSLAIE